MSLSLVRFLNYSKTPQRGVREFEILVDGSLIFRGILRRSGDVNGGVGWQSIIFSDSPPLIKQEGERVHCSSGEDSVLLINDGQVMNAGNSFATPEPIATEAERPSTAVPPADRPQTAEWGFTRRG